MKLVTFFTVQSFTNNTWLDNKLVQLTSKCQEWWADYKYPTIKVDTYTDLYVPDSEWIVIQTAGDIITERDHLWHKLTTIPDDVGLITHLVWYKTDETPHISLQCIILRTSAISNLNFSPYIKESKSFVRSDTDMHHGDSPYEITHGDTISRMQYGIGTDIINQVLTNGFKVINFDNDWRFGSNTWPVVVPYQVQEILNQFNWPHYPSRGFCFPTVGTNLFAKALEELTIYPNLDPSQIMLIGLLQGIIDLQTTKVINILHWDIVPQTTEASHVITPANGFLGETIALRTGAKKITFYDVNPNNLEFKKSLYNVWNEQDYIRYATTWATERNLITEPKWNSSKEVADEFNFEDIAKNWDYFKSLEVSFVLLDIIQDPDNFASLITDNSLVHTSTILNYYPITHMLYTSNDVDRAIEIISHKIQQTNSTLVQT